MTAAAEELVVTQPSISAAVAALSREIGMPLTERVGRTIRLSAAGATFVPYASDVLGLLEQGRLAAHEVAAESSRQVRIAAVTTAAEHIVPPLMQAFSAKRPEIELMLEVGNRDRMFSRVDEHIADVVIGGRPPADDRLSGVAFMANETLLIAPPDDPLGGGQEVGIDELADRVWLLREEGSGTRQMTEQFLRSHELSPRVLTLGSNGAIKQGARAGLGISLQASVAVGLELEAGQLSQIRTRVELPRRQWYVLRSSIGPVREPVAAFVEFVSGSGPGR